MNACVSESDERTGDQRGNELMDADKIVNSRQIKTEKKISTCTGQPDTVRQPSSNLELAHLVRCARVYLKNCQN